MVGSTKRVSPRVGILALQGAFREHTRALQSLGVETREVRLPQDLIGLDGLILPGGESTTIGKLLVEYQLLEPIRTFAMTNPIWGTCAGAILLAKDVDVAQTGLGLMDIAVRRNAFGRQIDSFQTNLSVVGLESPFPAIFIRAPLITRVGEDVTVLARLENGGIVAARQGLWWATSFHPELTLDTRIHQLFVDQVLMPPKP